MNYQDVVDLVRQISNAINPSGHFVHGRNTDGSLDYDYPFPQIHLLPVQTTYDVVNDVKDHTLIVMFWEQDSPESSNDEREAKIAAMDQLSDLFLAAIYNNTVFQVGDVLKTPEYRQLAGTASGYGLSFSLITKVDCDEEPFQLCQDAEYELTFLNTPVLSGTIPSGGFESIAIDPYVPPCPDAVAVLRDTDATVISTTNIPSGSTQDITAPDASYELTIGGNPVDSGNILSGGFDSIAIDAFIPACDPVDIEVNGTPEGSIASGSTLDIQLTDGVNPVTPDSVTQVGNTLTIEVPSTSPAGWQRPNDWLTLPNVTSSNDTFVALHAVFPSGNNFAAFRFTTSAGQYRVDWGDGVIDLVNSNVTAEHTYDYSTYDPTNSTLSSRGYKQAIIVVTAVSGLLRTCNLDFRVTTVPAQNQIYATGFLDCILSMPNANSGASIQIYSTDAVRHSYIEQFQILNSGGCTSYNVCFAWCRSLQSVPIISATNVTNMTGMFYECSSLKSISLINTQNVTNMFNMFFACRSLITIPLLNTQNVTNMSSMFNSCFSLETIPLLNTQNVTNMSGMFNACYSLKTIPLLNTQNVTNMSSMFIFCRSLQEIPLLNTTSVTNMSNMFNGCFSLETIPLLNTQNVTNMNSMLSGCFSLETIPLLNTQNVTNMSNMFSFCRSLQEIPLLNTQNVTNMSNMFSDCNNIKKVPLLNTASVTNMESMFNNCSSLETIPLLNTQNVTNVLGLFYFCRTLKNVPLLNTQSATNMSFMFENCSALNEIPAFNTTNVTNFSSFAPGCNSLDNTNIICRNSVTFQNCQLSRSALVNIFNNLLNRTSMASANINITGNWGATALTPAERAIATGKNWTITG